MAVGPPCPSPRPVPMDPFSRTPRALSVGDDTPAVPPTTPSAAGTGPMAEAAVSMAGVHPAESAEDIHFSGYPIQYPGPHVVSASMPGEADKAAGGLVPTAEANGGERAEEDRRGGDHTGTGRNAKSEEAC